MMVVGLALVCAGCVEEPGGDQDELKDPHVVQGKNLEKSLDFQAAVEAFNRALEVNPANAVAHFELFYLYEQKAIDYPAAIYHGERYLKLRPTASNAELIRQRILGCKQELVKSLPMGPITPALQRDFERLTTENRLLHQRIEQLTQQVGYLSTNRAYAAQSATNAGPGAISNPAFEPPKTPATPASTVRSMSVTFAKPAKPYKIHTVESGETLAKIARKYNVRLPTLMNANPQLDPRKIKTGQTVNIPQ
jgi:tetratricopeptide (TPR) repeat protein